MTLPAADTGRRYLTPRHCRPMSICTFHLYASEPYSHALNAGYCLSHITKFIVIITIINNSVFELSGLGVKPPALFQFPSNSLSGTPLLVRCRPFKSRQSPLTPQLFFEYSNTDDYDHHMQLNLLCKETAWKKNKHGRMKHIRCLKNLLLKQSYFCWGMCMSLKCVGYTFVGGDCSIWGCRYVEYLSESLTGCSLQP